jgi:hypothetical protein
MDTLSITNWYFTQVRDGRDQTRVVLNGDVRTTSGYYQFVQVPAIALRGCIVESRGAKYGLVDPDSYFYGKDEARRVRQEKLMDSIRR